MAFGDELLLLVQDLLHTPGAREVRVLWDTPRNQGQPPRWQTFNPLDPPTDIRQVPPAEGVEEVTVYLEGHLAGVVPSSSMIRHINGKRLRVGCDPLPTTTHVVSSAASWYLLRTHAGFDGRDAVAGV